MPVITSLPVPADNLIDQIVIAGLTGNLIIVMQ